MFNMQRAIERTYQSWQAFGRLDCGTRLKANHIVEGLPMEVGSS